MGETTATVVGATFQVNNVHVLYPVSYQKGEVNMQF